MAQDSTRDPDPLEAALRQLVTSGDRATRVLDALAEAYVGGADILPKLERLGRTSWFLSAMLLLSLDEEEAQETLKGLELTADERVGLRELYDRYQTVLGRIAHIFFDAFTRGLENTIDYIDVSPSYVPNREEVVLDLKLYSGDSLAFHSIDTAAALLWLVQNITTRVAHWLKWVEDKSLPLSDEQIERLRVSMKSLGEAMQELSSLKQIKDREEPDSA